MQQIENQLDIALKKIKNGEHIASVAFGASQETREQIYFAAAFVNSLERLQKKFVPEPVMRRLYLNKQPKANLWNNLISIISLRTLAVSMAAFVLVISATLYAAAQSLPGDILFPVKKAYETNVIKLASDPETRLRFEIDLTNKRLQEAQTVIARKDTSSQLAAMNELESQTKSTLEKFKEIASNPGAAAAKVAKDQEIINNFKEISKAQEILAVNIGSRSIQESSKETKKNLNEIKNIIAAASSEQIAIELPVIKDLHYTGSVKSIKENIIAVDKNIFIADDRTTIKTDGGEKLTLNDINIGEKVTITGSAKDNKNMAEQIIVNRTKDETVKSDDIKTDSKTDKLDKDKADKKVQKIISPEVKGASDEKRSKTQKDQDKPMDKSEDKKQEDKNQQDKQEKHENTSDPAKPKDTFGDFIIEAPIQVEIR